MIAAFRYFGKDYLLSYRYFAPLLVYLFSLVFIYSVVPNPVMPSYSFTSSLLFAVSAWLAFGYVDLEHETQQMLTSIHMRSLKNYYFYKMIPIVILIVVLSFIDVIYPIVFDKFNRTPTLSEMVIALLCHIVLSLLGMSAGFLFTKKFFPKWYVALGGLFVFIAISFAGQGITQLLSPSLQFLAWLLPPMFRTMDMLNHYDEFMAIRVAVAIVLPFIYSLIVLGLFLIGTIRRRF